MPSVLSRLPQLHAQELGRSLFVQVSITADIFLSTFVIHGVVNNYVDSPARSQIDEFLCSAEAELATWHAGPKQILGDFSGGVTDFSTIERLTNESAWSDLGAWASYWVALT